MPFKSKAQARYMFSQHPDIAKEFAAHTPSIKKLPEHKTSEGKAMENKKNAKHHEHIKLAHEHMKHAEHHHKEAKKHMSKVEKHKDMKEDKKLITKMVKPSAMKHKK